MMGCRTTWCADKTKTMTYQARNTTAAALIAALALPGAALAHSYTYIEGGYLNRDNGVVDDSGFRIAGSGQIARQFALIGEYADTGRYEQFSFGGQFFAPINRDLDWTAGATLEFVDIGPRDDTGFGLRAGLRWRFAQAFEMHPEIRHVDVFDRGDTSLRLAGLFHFDPNLAIQAALQGGDDDRFEAGIRYSFAPGARR
jgi:hypothetical protein